MLFRIFQEFFPGSQVPFPPGCDDLYMGRQGIGTQFKTDLVITLAGSPVSDRISPGFTDGVDRRPTGYREDFEPPPSVGPATARTGPAGRGPRLAGSQSDPHHLRPATGHCLTIQACSADAYCLYST